MKKDNKKVIKKNIQNSPEVNFHNINSIMNQRLVGLLDYLKASVYFSVYNTKEVKNEKNLKKFFKSKIFARKPFILNNDPKMILNNNKKQNKQLNVIVNFKNNKINFKKNKFTSAFDLHSKKSHFLKNMVILSKHNHSEAKKEENIKKTYPKLQSISLYSPEFIDFSKNQIFLTPRISRYDSGITVERSEKYTSTREFKRNYKSVYDFNFTKFFPYQLNNNYKYVNDRNRIKSSKTWLSLDYGKEKEFFQSKQRFKLRIRNLYERNKDEYAKEGINTYFHNNSNTNYNNEIKKPKTTRVIKSLKPNCYYNNLHLLKLSKLLKKNSYQSVD